MTNSDELFVWYIASVILEGSRIVDVEADSFQLGKNSFSWKKRIVSLEPMIETVFFFESDTILIKYFHK